MMEFAHFKTAAQFGRRGVNAKLAQRLALYRRLTAKAMAELARERGVRTADLLAEEKEFTCAYCGVRRYHLPGQHDQCDHSPTGECSPEKDVSREERRSQLIAQTDNLDLDDNHREAANSYVGSGYRDINGLLRQTGTLKGERLSNAKSRIIDLDSTIMKSKLDKPITVYRGMLDRDGQFANPEQLMGKIIEDRGFVSTTLRKQLADDFAEPEGKSEGARFRISIPAGKNALYVSAPKLGGDGEQELLLPRRTRLRITKISDIGGKKWIDATVE